MFYNKHFARRTQDNKKTPYTIISDTITTELINKSVLFAQLDKFFDTFG